MADDLKVEMPCLIDTGRGISVLYKERYLYSKYSPDKAIIQAIDALEILSGALILVFSPCLWYGLKELLLKTEKKEDCLIVGIEADENLFELSKNALEKLKESLLQAQNVLLIKPEQIEKIIMPVYRFKRVQMIEMSGGTFFGGQIYKNVFMYAQNTIASFWKNRVTLVKLGRLFSRNFFKNLQKNPAVNNASILEKTITNPIVVFGAGQGAQVFIDSIQKITGNASLALKKCCVIAVDAALPLLKANGIKVDFAIAVEGQLASEKAYIGCKDYAQNILCDMSSRKNTALYKKVETFYFMSEFDNCTFIHNAKDKGILPIFVPALGSVGLTASYLALMLRKIIDVPVFCAGLDFSFSTGFTHARGTPAHKARLFSCAKFKPVENYDAAFKLGSFKIEGKNGDLITDHSLKNYADLFRAYFCSIKNFFDASPTGLDLSINRCKTEFFIQTLSSFNKNYNALPTKKAENSESIKKLTQDYIQNEKKSLERIKELLSKGEKAFPPPKQNLNHELKELLLEREYLYLHFPDGYKCRYDDLSFLKRVRSEIDFFIKDLS